MPEAPTIRMVREGGPNAPLVLFLPGLTGNNSQWDPVVERLASRELSIAYGAPIRPHPAFDGKQPTVTELAARMKAELDSRSYSSAVVVAHSVGAFVAFALCRLLPDRVQTAILLNGGLTTVARFLDRPVVEMSHEPIRCLNAIRLFALAGSPTPPGVKRVIASSPRLTRLLLGKLASEDTVASQKQRASLIEHGGSTDVLRALWTNRHHWQEFRAYAHLIEAHAIFVVGELDPMSNEADTRIMASMLPDAHLRSISGIGHVAPVETAAVVAGLVGEAIDGLRVSGPH
ncbi:alpha/beta hydrolase [Motilibacter sp. E257]|uniref:Alpha/beta hydrolase n=2 Tax=Motilibacter deserti TaxID=2714956 RepID=A0ABX0GRC3_9ACTN|nr:alpha/beta hydrolase [Motilibacter deserti]